MVQIVHAVLTLDGLSVWLAGNPFTCPRDNQLKCTGGTFNNPGYGRGHVILWTMFGIVFLTAPTVGLNIFYSWWKGLGPDSSDVCEYGCCVISSFSQLSSFQVKLVKAYNTFSKHIAKLLLSLYETAWGWNGPCFDECAWLSGMFILQEILLHAHDQVSSSAQQEYLIMAAAIAGLALVMYFILFWMVCLTVRIFLTSVSIDACTWCCAAAASALWLAVLNLIALVCYMQFGCLVWSALQLMWSAAHVWLSQRAFIWPS